MGTNDTIPAVLSTPCNTKVLAVRVALPVRLWLNWDPLEAINLPVLLLAFRAKVPLPAVLIEPVELTRRSLKPVRERLPVEAEMARLMVRAPLLVLMVVLPSMAKPG